MVTMMVSAQTISDSTPETCPRARRAAAGRCVQRFAERVDRAGADVAVDDAERAEHQDRSALLAGTRRPPALASSDAGLLRHRFGQSRPAPPVSGRPGIGAVRQLLLQRKINDNHLVPGRLITSRRRRGSGGSSAPCRIPARRRSGRGRSTPRQGRECRFASAGRLATVRSWPALTPHAESERRIGRLSQQFQHLWRPFRNRRGSRHRDRYRARSGRRRWPSPPDLAPGSASANSDTRMPPALQPRHDRLQHARSSPRKFQPWSDVACDGSSGTSVTCSGWCVSTSARNSSVG